MIKVFLLAMVIAACGGIALSSLSLYRSLVEVRSLRNAANSTKMRESANFKEGSTQLFARDFVADLPVTVEVQTVLDQLRRASFDAGVLATNVEVQGGVQALDQLPRTNLTVSLSGPYPSLKRVIAELLDRFPQATATRFSIRRGAQGGSAEITIAIALWARPEPTVSSSPELSSPRAPS